MRGGSQVTGVEGGTAPEQARAPPAGGGGGQPTPQSREKDVSPEV